MPRTVKVTLSASSRSLTPSFRTHFLIRKVASPNSILWYLAVFYFIFIFFNEITDMMLYAYLAQFTSLAIMTIFWKKNYNIFIPNRTINFLIKSSRDPVEFFLPFKIENKFVLVNKLMCKLWLKACPVISFCWCLSWSRQSVPYLIFAVIEQWCYDWEPRCYSAKPVFHGWGYWGFMILYGLVCLTRLRGTLISGKML